jgi:hypothetical protein
MSFSSDGPLTVDGKDVAQRFEQRFDNPWTQADWKGQKISIADGDGAVELDLAAGTRRAS